jgi:mannose-6-phosphate isomerase-like protein (cupin superfamily)
MKFSDHEAIVQEGEFIVVPRGMEHCPVADEEVHIVLIEPKSTLNTGNITNERTVAQLEHI